MAEPTKPVSKPVSPKMIFLEAVYGRMVDLTTGIEYTEVPKEVIRLNGFLQSQIDEGKMRVTYK